MSTTTDTDDDTDPETIGEAKRAVTGLETRIATLEATGADEEYLDELRAKRADLQRRIEISQSRARSKSAVDNLIQSLEEHAGE